MGEKGVCEWPAVTCGHGIAPAKRGASTGCQCNRPEHHGAGYRAIVENHKIGHCNASLISHAPGESERASWWHRIRRTIFSKLKDHTIGANQGDVLAARVGKSITKVD